VQATDEYFGEIIGRYFVEEAFAGDSKARCYFSPSTFPPHTEYAVLANAPVCQAVAQDMIQAIERAFASNLNGLSWMDSLTKSRALAKLHQIVNKIGTCLFARSGHVSLHSLCALV
jgi:predicted metalloendopeptidase